MFTEGQNGISCTSDKDAILPWDRKSFLTQAISPRLSREGFIHWLYWISRTQSSSDVIVILK